MKRFQFLRLSFVSILFALAAASALAQSDDQQSAAGKYFTDVTLLNQNGEEVRFYSDLLQGKVVVINVFFTSCEGVCPVTASTFAKIQDLLGDRLGKDVHLISISVDPTNDTPTKLKAYAERFHAKDGWHLLTGKKENVEQALYKLGQYVKDPESHSNIFIVGNEPTGLWKKVLGLSKPQEIFRIVQGVQEDKE